MILICFSISRETMGDRSKAHYKKRQKPGNQYDPRWLQHPWNLNCDFGLNIAIPGGSMRKKDCGQIMHVSIESKYKVSSGTLCVIKVQTNRNEDLVLAVSNYTPSRMPPTKLALAPIDDRKAQKAFAGHHI